MNVFLLFLTRNNEGQLRLIKVNLKLCDIWVVDRLHWRLLEPQADDAETGHEHDDRHWQPNGNALPWLDDNAEEEGSECDLDESG